MRFNPIPKSIPNSFSGSIKPGNSRVVKPHDATRNHAARQRLYGLLVRIVLVNVKMAKSNDGRLRFQRFRKEPFDQSGMWQGCDKRVVRYVRKVAGGVPSVGVGKGNAGKSVIGIETAMLFASDGTKDGGRTSFVNPDVN